MWRVLFGKRCMLFIHAHAYCEKNIPSCYMFHSGVVRYSVHRKGNRNCSFVCFWKLNISQRSLWFLMTVCNNWTNQKQQSTIFHSSAILYVSRIYNVKSILMAISKPYDKIALKLWTNKCIIIKEYTFHVYNTITYLCGRQISLLSDCCLDPNLSYYFPWCQYQLLSYTECHFRCGPPVNKISGESITTSVSCWLYHR